MSVPPRRPDMPFLRLVRGLDWGTLLALMIFSALAALFLLIQAGIGRPPEQAEARIDRPTVSATASPAPPTTTPSRTATPTPTATSSPRPEEAGSGMRPTPSRTPTALPTPRVEPLNFTTLYAGTPFSVQGQGAPGHTIALYDNDRLLGTVRVGPRGTWAIAVPGLAVGEHTLVVVAISPADATSDPAPVGFLIVHRPTATPTATFTRTPVPTATFTHTPAPTATPSRTPAPTRTYTPVPTATFTHTPAPTVTPSRTPAPTVTPSRTPAPTVTPSRTPAPTRTYTPVPTATSSPRPEEAEAGASVTPTLAPIVTVTGGDLGAEFQPLILTPVPSATSTITNTPVPTRAPTTTPRVTSSHTPIPSATHTPIPSATPSRTPVPTRTFTSTPTATLTRTPTPTVTHTATFTPTSTPSHTPTSTPTDIPTVTATITPAPPVILQPASGEMVPAGLYPFTGQADPHVGVAVALVDSVGMVLGQTTAGPGGVWTITADLTALQGETTVTALALDGAGLVLAQSPPVQITIAPQLAPVTGGETPDGGVAAWLNVGLILTIILALALLIGGVALRQAGRLLRLREDDRER